MRLIVILILAASLVPLVDAILNCSAFARLNPYTLSPYQNLEARLHACFNANLYDTTQLPCPQSMLPLVIQYDWSLINLLSFQDGVLSVLYQLMLMWTDSMREWALTDLPVAFIEIPVTELWYPRFYAFANKKKYISVDPSEQVAHLRFSGMVMLGIVNEIESPCEINLWNFPFDTQNCEISYLGTRQFLGLNGMDVVLVKSPTTYRFKSFPNDEWEIINVQTTTNNVSVKQYDYSSSGSLSDQPALVLENIMNGFTVTIRLRRFYNYFLVNVFAPIIVLSILDMLPFFIEETSVDKLVCGLTVISGFMFVQGIVADLLPKSDVTPFLALYISSSLFVSAGAILAGGLCYYICQFEGKPNRVVSIIVLKGLGFLLYPNEWVALVKRCSQDITSKKKSAKVANSVIDLNGRRTNSNATIMADDSVSTIELETATATGTKNKERLREFSPDINEFFENLESAYAKSHPQGSIEWLRVAHVLNRLFALLHFAALVALIAIFLIPIWKSYSSPPPD